MVQIGILPKDSTAYEFADRVTTILNDEARNIFEAANGIKLD